MGVRLAGNKIYPCVVSEKPLLIFSIASITPSNALLPTLFTTNRHISGQHSIFKCMKAPLTLWSCTWVGDCPLVTDCKVGITRATGPHKYIRKKGGQRKCSGMLGQTTKFPTWLSLAAPPSTCTFQSNPDRLGGLQPWLSLPHINSSQAWCYVSFPFKGEENWS